MAARDEATASAATAPEDVSRLAALSVLERRRELARRCQEQRVNERRREDHARALGYASCAALERAASREERRKAVARKGSTWNKGGDFGARGHKAYALQQEVAHTLLEHAALGGNLLKERFPMTAAEATPSQAARGEGERAVRTRRPRLSPHEEVSLRGALEQRVAREHAKAREVQVVPLRRQIEVLQTRCREQRAMRMADFESVLLRMARGGKEGVEKTAEARFLLRSAREDVRIIDASFGKRIKALEQRAQSLEGELTETFADKAVHEWQQQIARWTYSVACRAAGLGESRQLMATFGGKVVEVHRYGLCPEHVEALCFAIEALPRTEALRLRSNSLQAAHCHALCTLYSRPAFGGLREIDLQGNQLGISGTCALLHAMYAGSAPSALRVLRLASNGLQGKSDGKASAHALGKALQAILTDSEGRGTALECLDLGDNALDDAIVLAVAKALPSSALQELSLRYCTPKARCRQALMHGISGAPALRKLDLAACALGNREASALSTILAAHAPPLEHLDVSNNNKIVAAGARALAGALVGQPQLETLRIAGCGFGLSGCRALVQALGSNSVLQELTCDHRKCLFNPICRDGTLEKLVYMGIANEREFDVVVQSVTSYVEIQARELVLGVAPGHAPLPRLVESQQEQEQQEQQEQQKEQQRFAFQVTHPTFEACSVGMRCQAYPFKCEGGPWLNAEVVEVVPAMPDVGRGAQARVALVDFRRQMDGDAEHYNPTAEWADPMFPLQADYPLVELAQLRVSVPDLAVLTLQSQHGTKASEAPVYYPLGLLPPWLRRRGATGFVKSCLVDKEARNAPVFSFVPQPGGPFCELACTDVAHHAPLQTPFLVLWPKTAFAPRPELLRPDNVGVRPAMRSTRERASALHGGSPAGAGHVSFAFYKQRGSVTATLRMLTMQTASKTAQ